MLVIASRRLQDQSTRGEWWKRCLSNIKTCPLWQLAFSYIDDTTFTSCVIILPSQIVFLLLPYSVFVCGSGKAIFGELKIFKSFLRNFCVHFMIHFECWTVHGVWFKSIRVLFCTVLTVSLRVAKPWIWTLCVLHMCLINFYFTILSSEAWIM